MKSILVRLGAVAMLAALLGACGGAESPSIATADTGAPPMSAQSETESATQAGKP